MINAIKNLFSASSTETAGGTVDTPANEPAQAPQAADVKSAIDSKWPVTRQLVPRLHPDNMKKAESAAIAEKMPDVVSRLNSPVPGGYDALIAEHCWLYDVRSCSVGPLSRDLWQLVNARQALIARAINAITGANQKPLSISAQDLGRGHLSRHINGPRDRAAKIARYEAAIKEHDGGNAGYFIEQKIMPLRPLALHFVWLLSREFVVEIGCVREKLVRYELKRLHQFGLIYPSARLDELRYELEICADLERANALNTEATLLTSQAIKATSNAVCAALRIAWEPVQDQLRMLLRSAKNYFESEQKDIANMEKALFGSHPMGIQYKPTMAVTSFDPVIAELEHHLTPPKPYPRPHIDAPAVFDGENTVLSFIFGLPVLPD